MTDQTTESAGIIPLAEIVTRIAQAAYARCFFNSADVSAVETVAAVSELFSVRMADIRHFGNPVRGPTVRNSKLFEWLQIEADLSIWEDTALRAMISFLRYEHQAETASIESLGEALKLTLINCRTECEFGLPHDREVLSFWSRLIAVPNGAIGEWTIERLPYV